MLEKLRTLIVTLLWWAVLLLDAFIFALLLVFLPDRFRNGIALRTSSVLLLKAAGVKVRVKGLDNVLKEKPQIFVANHVSWFDSFVLCSVLPVAVTFASKKEMFRVPVYNYIMRRLHFICVDRERVRDAVSSIENAAGIFDSGLSLVVFPEGTTSKTGELGSFKRGAVLLAARAQVPIVPVAVINTRKIKFRGSPLIHYGVQTEVRISEPVEAYSMDRQNQQNTVKSIKAEMEMNLKDVPDAQ
ncbi:MAG: 1-acyl-sn-glycerol-3-phosphate acyltransferase [Candidatus Sabulitectum sp.]|nr:1-acyl-sn-glycerol-3-phosphate acyltransferase [Candidatus Sabulitectum sp.]